MKPIVAAASRYVHDADYLDGAQAKQGAGRITARLTAVERRYGTPQGGKMIRSWVLAALANVQKAIYIRDKLHDLDLYSYWLAQARENVGKARSTLNLLHAPTRCKLPRPHR